MMIRLGLSDDEHVTLARRWRPCAWLLALMVLAGCTRSTGNLGGIVVMLDFSKTFVPYTANDTAMLDAVNGSLLEMLRINRMPQPTKIAWAAFGDNGLQPVQPCGPASVFKQLFTKSALEQTPDNTGSSASIVSIDDLEHKLSACARAVSVLSRTGQDFTDISGAIAFGANSLSNVIDERLLIVFSDFREDLPPGRASTAFVLKQDRVVLLWRPGLDDQKDPSVVPKRVEEWANRIRMAGASRLCTIAATGVTAGDITSCLWNEPKHD